MKTESANNSEVREKLGKIFYLVPIFILAVNTFFISLPSAFAASPPSIKSISPNNSPTAGGTSVIVSGSGFANNATVTFGGASATLVKFINSNQINATTPPHSAGIVSVQVKNPDGKKGTLTNGFTYVAPPPLAANAGSDQTITEGVGVAFSGSATGGTAPLSYAWNFGDGSAASGSLTPMHSYTDNGIYTVTLTVVDGSGVTSSDTAVVTVLNVAPSVLIGGPYTAMNGSSITFSVTVTDPSSIDTAAGFRYLWNFGDGGTSTSSNPNYTYQTTGTYTVALTVTDKDEGSSSITTIATMNAPSTSKVFPLTYGVYALMVSDDTISSYILTNPNVDGVHLRTHWDSIERSDGVYDWSYLDNQITLAANNGKKISISVDAGWRTPSWVYGAGANSFRYIFDAKGWGTQYFCTEVMIPVPWDPIFLSKWKRFIQALGNRYANNPTVTYIRMAGINRETPETSLPHKRNEAISNATTSCTTYDDVANWVQAGYTAQKIKETWQTIADTYAQAFPNKQILTSTYPDSFPPINNCGTITSGKGDELPKALFELGMARFGPQFILQNDGLSATWSWNVVDNAGLNSQAMIAYQMLSAVTNDSTCRMNGGQIPCDPATVLQQAVDRGINAGSKFLEIYRADIENPNLQTVISNTHTSLLSRAVPIAAITGVPVAGYSPVGITVTLRSVVADPFSVNPADLIYAWSVTKNGTELASGSGSSFSFAPDAYGAYVVSLTVTDSAERQSPTTTTTVVTVPPLAPKGSFWKFLDNGSDQGTTWRTTSFDDSIWTCEGPAQLGYGDGDEKTVVSYGPNSNNKYITTYFRRSLNVADPSIYKNLTLNVLRDDGAIVYLNGTEVFRTNMPTGSINYNTLALSDVTGVDETTNFYSIGVNPSFLVNGTNVLAVETHQQSASNSDISFDLELIGETNHPPVFNSISNQTVDEGKSLSFTVLATDADNDPLIYSTSNLPQGSSFDSSTRTFSWIPTYDQAGTYSVTFTVSDGKDQTTQIVLITVNNMNRAPTLGTISPSSGTSAPDTWVSFTTTYSDLDGVNDLKAAYLLINTAINEANSVSLQYRADLNKLYLKDDAGVNYLGGLAPGASAILENSQVKLDLAGTSISKSGTTLTVTWRLSFKASYSGKQYNTYLRAGDLTWTMAEWQPKGTWTVN